MIWLTHVTKFSLVSSSVVPNRGNDSLYTDTQKSNTNCKYPFTPINSATYKHSSSLPVKYPVKKITVPPGAKLNNHLYKQWLCTSKSTWEYRTHVCSAFNVCEESHAWNVNYLTTISKYIQACDSPLHSTQGIRAFDTLFSLLLCTVGTSTLQDVTIREKLKDV